MRCGFEHASEEGSALGSTNFGARHIVCGSSAICGTHLPSTLFHLVDKLGLGSAMAHVAAADGGSALPDRRQHRHRGVEQRDADLVHLRHRVSHAPLAEQRRKAQVSRSDLEITT